MISCDLSTKIWLLPEDLLSKSVRHASTSHCFELRNEIRIHFIVQVLILAIASRKTENLLAVSGSTGAGGLVAPLPCTSYFSKLTSYSFVRPEGPK